MWDVRYRPLRFDDVLGQEGAVQVLKARLSKGTALDTSYIFSGGHGQGKTTLARILGRAMLCQNLTPEAEPCNQCENCKDALNETAPALSEMDAASRGTVDAAREIVDKLSFMVEGASKRIYIFDEAHRMSRDAQDVLLKPLEDKRLVGIFCTTEPDKIRGPIRSRCEEYPIRKITREHILDRMKRVLSRENVEYEDDAVMTVIDYFGGHVRDILNKLEMVAQLGPISIQAVRDHLNLSVISTYYEILLALGDPTVSVPLTDTACDLVGPEEVAEGLAEAAMSSYRLAHGMFAEFTHVDRVLAQKVHAIYGDHVIKLSEYFLRSYRTSKISLLSDIIACSSGIPTLPASAVTQPPVVLQAPLAHTTTQAIQVPAQVPAQALPQVPAQALPQVPAQVPAQALPQAKSGAGNKGSGDSRALTSIDEFGIAPKAPRSGSETNAKPLRGPKELFLTPEEFRIKFLIQSSKLLGHS